MKHLICTIALGLFGSVFPAVLFTQAEPPQQEWISLFNGRDLTGWTPKIRGYELGENVADTFAVRAGALVVGYQGYEEWDSRFGHIFYKQPYSHYRLRLEYRFVGEQVPGGPGWAFRNSGIMLHCQSPESMARDQSFPVSIEVQLLGGKGEGRRTTANLCTPGTHVVMNGKLLTRHCTNSKSKTYHNDQWVSVEVEVRGGGVIKHFVNGRQVMQYEKPQLDESDEDAKKLVQDGEKLLRGGYISLQSESHPVEFRRIELLDLSK